MPKYVIKFVNEKSSDNGKYADNTNGELVGLDDATVYTDFEAAKMDIYDVYEMVVPLDDIKG